MDNHHQNISVIGIGRLGLAWALVLEKAGYNVIGCDINYSLSPQIHKAFGKICDLAIDYQIFSVSRDSKNIIASV